MKQEEGVKATLSDGIGDCSILDILTPLSGNSGYKNAPTTNRKITAMPNNG